MAKKKNPSPGPESSSLPPDEGPPELPTPLTASPARDENPKSRLTPKKAAKKPVKAKAPQSPPRDMRDVMHTKALDLAIKASETFDPKRRTTLAKEAIKFNPDCAEAYLLLAEGSKNRKTALGLFEQAVAAAERTLGPELFVEGVGHFWSLLETRPYMRARAGLAEAAWASGRREDAVEHLGDMLRLNPGDNQGLRYLLAGWLLNLDRVDALHDLLEQYDEDSATWNFTRALASFRTEGDSPASRKLLQTAKKSNKHVIDFLTGRKTLPSEPPPYYSPGGEDDAVLYVANHLGAWKSTPGSLTWVKSATMPKKRKAKGRIAEGPSVASEQRLLELPAEVDTWQADFRQFARRIEVGGERIRPWMVLVSSRSRELVLGHAMVEQEPTADSLWDILTGAMEHPAMGDPHRPTEIQVRADSTWEALEAPLEAIGVTCAPTEALDQIDFLFENLAKHLEGVKQPGLLDMPGVTEERVERFYEVAAEFYRRAPWRALGYEAIIQVECDRYDSGPWYAVVMGQSGLTLGLALYEDLALLRRMYAGKLSDEEGARRTVALTVTFDDEGSLAETDLEAIEANAWPIASPEGFPSFFRKERGLSMRPPLVWEIDLMVACLAALPDFIARRALDDPTRELVAVPDASGTPLELGLSWVPEPN